jgi:flagellar hook-basal body complex protein FliE
MNISSLGNRLVSGLDLEKEMNSNLEDSNSFKDIIKEQMNRVNDMQIEADDMTNKFIAGEIDDLHSVMIATEEARLSLELAVQIRNRCVEAYKEINNMQL